MRFPAGARALSKIGAWALYDFANTIYSLNIVTYQFPLWLVERGVPEWKYAVTVGASSFAAALVLPLFGRFSDRLKTRQAPLAACTLACAALTAAMGHARSITAAVLLFAAAQIFYQAALVVYNAEIVGFGGRRAQGIVSGLGVGAGYAGTMLSLLALRPFFESTGRQGTFTPTAVIFLVLSLPCLLLCGGKKAPASELPREGCRDRGVAAAGKFLRTPALRFFAVFSFVILNVTAVVIAMMTVFAKKGALFTDAETERMIFLSSAAGIAGAVIFGFRCGRSAPLRLLGIITGLWAAAFLLNFGYRMKPFFFSGCGVAGFALGATWSVSRVFLAELTDPREIGETFGLFAALGRLAAISGPFLTALLLLVFSQNPVWRYASVNALLLVAVAVAGFFLAKIPSRDGGQDFARPAQV